MSTFQLAGVKILKLGRRDERTLDFQLPGIGEHFRCAAGKVNRVVVGSVLSSDSTATFRFNTPLIEGVSSVIVPSNGVVLQSQVQAVDRQLAGDNLGVVASFDVGMISAARPYPVSNTYLIKVNLNTGPNGSKRVQYIGRNTNEESKPALVVAETVQGITVRLSRHDVVPGTSLDLAFPTGSVETAVYAQGVGMSLTFTSGGQSKRVSATNGCVGLVDQHTEAHLTASSRGPHTSDSKSDSVFVMQFL